MLVNSFDILASPLPNYLCDEESFFVGTLREDYRFLGSGNIWNQEVIIPAGDEIIFYLPSYEVNDGRLIHVNLVRNYRFTACVPRSLIVRS